jgi:hypothetical protein
MEGSELSIVALLVAVLVACLVYWAPTRIMAAFGVGDPIRTVVIVVLVVLLCIWLLGMLGLRLPSGILR